jgi:hypothetical protein
MPLVRDSPHRRHWDLVRKSNGVERRVTKAGGQDGEVIAGIVGILLLGSRGNGFGSIMASNG